MKFEDFRGPRLFYRIFQALKMKPNFPDFQGVSRICRNRVNCNLPVCTTKK